MTEVGEFDMWARNRQASGRAVMNAGAAFTGLAGDVVDVLSPHTEADDMALLMTFLVAFGAAVGPGPHAAAGGAAHPARLNVVLVGRSSRARKGTSLAAVRPVFDLAAPGFRQRVVGGLASGPGLVAELAGRGEGLDRSILVVESEFGRVLRVAARDASLSALIREAWDGGVLAVLTRSKPLSADGASVSILGHVTVAELGKRLSDVEIAGGTGNRCLFCWVERSKRLPSGGQVPDDELDVLGIRVGVAIDRARQIGRMARTPAAEGLWADIYNALDDEADGVVGALCARAEAQMLRLSVAYALLDASAVIDTRHVESAHQVWRYCEDTVRRVFGEGKSTVRPADTVVNRLLAALAASPDGLDGTAQRDLFQRHETGETLARARAELAARGLAATVIDDSAGGRPRIITRLVANTHAGVWSQVAKSQPVAWPTSATCDLATEVGGSEPLAPTPPVPDSTDARKRARWMA
jgi:Protein of unknown function (DUF3987)